MGGRLGPRGVNANALHPGVIATALARHLVREDLEFLRKRAPGGKMGAKSMEAVNDEETATNGVRSFALDPEAAIRFWSVSEEMVGEHVSL
jgi:NAD(P)-dependent dehydrogenase (short-subunit alcohol dehydrogenase family)